MAGQGGLVTRLLRWKRRNWLIHPPDASWLRSQSYTDEMNHLLDGEPGLDEATDETENYNHRHRVVNRKLGIWRWRGMQEFRDEILDVVENGTCVVDFGGAACPLGLGATVVDLLPRDGAGWPVRHEAMSDLSTKADVVFTSHCLEHIEPLDEVLAEIRDGMVSGGCFLVFVPAWTCERWRAGVHENKLYNDHAWTFALSDDDSVPELERLKFIDDVIAKYFTIEKAVYCGDNSIYIKAIVE